MSIFVYNETLISLSVNKLCIYKSFMTNSPPNMLTFNMKLCSATGIHEISAQLNLTLAMDRCDVARESIFIESRKGEIRVSYFIFAIDPGIRRLSKHISDMTRPT